ICLIIANVIGSGIYTTPGFLARDLGSPFAVLGIWIVGAVLAFAGALSYSELGAMFPEAGGEYVYLREAFGSFFGFLTGWASFVAGKKRTKRFARSEEHTSELQSRVDLVCRLLLEKKKLHHVAVL